MKNVLQLGTVKGIKVSIHWTFLILIGWIVFTNVREGRTVTDIFWSVGFILSIFVCVVLHELGHALTAQRFHIKTKDITLYPIGGVARLESIPKKPREELLVALAGPAVNLLIVILLYPFIDIALLEDPNNLMVIGSANFVLAFVAVNFWLAIFNLIPAFPMDGGRVFRALLSFKINRAKATRIAASLGQVVAIGFVLLGFYANPFLIFIGLFIFLGAQAESNFVQVEALMEGHTLKDITMHETPALSADASVADAVHEVLNGQNRNFLVVENGKAIGTLGQLELIKALREKDESEVHLRDVMDKTILQLQASLSVYDALVKMQREKKSVAIVKDGDAEVGMVDTDNLGEFILIQGARKQFAEVE